MSFVLGIYVPENVARNNVCLTRSVHDRCQISTVRVHRNRNIHKFGSLAGCQLQDLFLLSRLSFVFIVKCLCVQILMSSVFYEM